MDNMQALKKDIPSRPKARQEGYIKIIESLGARLFDLTVQFVPEC